MDISDSLLEKAVSMPVNSVFVYIEMEVCTKHTMELSNVKKNPAWIKDENEFMTHIEEMKPERRLYACGNPCLGQRNGRAIWMKGPGNRI